MKRREFIGTAAGVGLTGLLSASPAGTWVKTFNKKLTILHTNDWHSRIEPFPKDGGALQGLGGAAARAALIEKIRREEEQVLLLDSGDIFQGTPYFNYFGGELEYKLMSRMGYDCSTLGNHDFDNGIDGIVRQLPQASFSFVNANYTFTGTALEQVVKPYRIFKKDGLRIGVFGLGIELKGLVMERLCEGVRYNDPIACANRIAQELKVERKCDLVVCLSHLGYEYKNNKVSDLVLAKSTSGIDLILGGHTHTFLPEPVIEKNTSGNPVMINQVGWAGVKLGRIDYVFNPLSDKGYSHSSMAYEVVNG